MTSALITIAAILLLLISNQKTRAVPDSGVVNLAAAIFGQI